MPVGFTVDFTKLVDFIKDPVDFNKISLNFAVRPSKIPNIILSRPYISQNNLCSVHKIDKINKVVKYRRF